MSTTLDTFVLRRMQDAALSRWQQSPPTSKELEDPTETEEEELGLEEIHHYTEPRQKLGAALQQQILNQLGDLDLSSSTLGSTLDASSQHSTTSSQHMRVRVSSCNSLLSLNEEAESETDNDFAGEAEATPVQESTTPPAATTASTPASTATAMSTIGRPHVGPRSWNQRPVFHDVLDCDLLGDDDDDFFGTSLKNKTIRSTKTTTPTTTCPTTTTTTTTTRPKPKGGAKKKKTTTTTRPQLSNKRSPAVSPRSLSPAPVRRNKVTMMAA